MTSTLGVIGHHKQHQHRVVTDINIINLMIIVIIINHKHQYNTNIYNTIWLYIYITICWSWSSTQGQASPNLSTLKAQTLLFRGQLPYIITRIQQLIIIKQSQSSYLSPVLKIWSLSISGVLLTVSRKNTAIRTRFTQTLECKGRTVSSPKNNTSGVSFTGLVTAWTFVLYKCYCCSRNWLSKTSNGTSPATS